ncbi:MAG TPA: cytochrome C biosynthesis protein [Bacteroidales bacterium]|nr:cytochrome C biosynthesis protein [Bacteroidales bacterium]
MKKSISCILQVFILLSSTGCNDTAIDNFNSAETSPHLSPDYSGVTIPYNISPINFRIDEKGSLYKVIMTADEGPGISIKSEDGRIVIPRGKWEDFTSKNKGRNFIIDVFVKSGNKKWIKYKPVQNTIAAEPIDPYLYYRLLYPGYESWSELSINMRKIQGFKTKTIIKNSIAEENCVNCHSFNNGRTGDFLFHMRGSVGGTFFYTDKGFRKTNLKTKEMKNGAVYPRWHPSGKYVVFSTNKIIQQFHSAGNKKVDVADLESSLVLYDVEKSIITDINLPGKVNSMDTYPEWSPDGRHLYFCRAPQIKEEYDYAAIRYNLYRVEFNPSGSMTEEPKLVFNADTIGKSVSFPRISPDGRFLVFTIADYGCFPIWHKEADLWLLDLTSMKAGRMDLNSDFTDSYHSLSSNGRWIVFSCKKDDDLVAKPYISYIDSSGKSTKPFILPQKDPDFYNGLLKSFNLPEFATFEIKSNPHIIRKAVFSGAIQAEWANSFLTGNDKQSKNSE